MTYERASKFPLPLFILSGVFAVIRWVKVTIFGLNSVRVFLALSLVCMALGVVFIVVMLVKVQKHEPVSNNTERNREQPDERPGRDYRREDGRVD